MSGKKLSVEGFTDLDLALPLDDDEADEIIDGSGIDPEAALARLLDRAQRLDTELRQATYEKAETARLSAVEALDRPRPMRSRSELLAILADMRNRGVGAQAMYKNLEDVTDADLESLVADLEHLERNGEDT